MIGTTVDLNASGQFSVDFHIDVPARVRVDILGYFDGQPSNAGFTPIAGRVFDSAVSPNTNIAAGATVDVPVNGVAGLPAYSASISGVALNVQTLASSAACSDCRRPGVPTVVMMKGSAPSNSPEVDARTALRELPPGGSSFERKGPR